MQADFHFTAHVGEAHEGDDCEAIVKLRLTMEANLAGACRNTPTKRALNGPDGMSKISEGSFVFKVRGIEIEGSNDVEVENPHFHIEICPITNAEFKRFLDASRCHPPNDLNFLRDWKNGAFPNGWAASPSRGFRWNTLAPMRNGQASACRTNGSGSMLRKAWTVALIPREIRGSRLLFLFLVTAAP